MRRAAQLEHDLALLRRIPIHGDLEPMDIIDIARLCIRYSHGDFGTEARGVLQSLLDAHGLTREQVSEQARAIWESRFRPSLHHGDGPGVGSGADFNA